jgi:hypothetical protein
MSDQAVLHKDSIRRGFENMNALTRSPPEEPGDPAALFSMEDLPPFTCLPDIFDRVEEIRVIAPEKGYQPVESSSGNYHQKDCDG